MKAPSILFLALLISSVSLAQSSKVLTVSKSYAEEISAGDLHRYSIKVKSNHFVVAVIDQDGTDLRISTRDGAGNKLEEFDSPNGKYGPEIVSFTSSAAGTYLLEVKPLDEHQLKGKYTIKLLRIEPTATTPEKRIDQLLSAVVLPGAPGATIAVANRDKVIFSKGYGSANPEYDIPNSPKTIFHVASISKQFTAFAIAMLVDQGKLSLDDDIRKYLPELPDFGHKITTRHLIHHTSGLRDQWNLLALAGWRLDDVITRQHVMQLMSHQKELNAKPGDEFNYCNTGYTLMAEIVSQVTGKSFAEWSAENIFIPLKMTNTLFYDDHEKIVKGRAYSFYETPGGIKKSVLSYANAGATSLFTTAEDLMKWSANFQSMKIGNPAVMNLMEGKAVLNTGDTLTYAFGQDIGQHKDLKAIRHGGADAGYRSFLIRFPEQGYSVAVLSNFASFNTGKIAHEIADIYLKQFFKEAPATPAVSNPVTASPSTSVSEDVLRRYAGRYELTPALIVDLKVEHGVLIAQATGQPSFQMQPRSETEFHNDAIGATIIFEKNDKGVVHQFILKQGGQTLVAPKLKDFDPLGVDLKEYVGTYYSEELETTYRLLIKDNKLIAEHIRHEPTVLTVSREDVFSSSQWFMGMLEFWRTNQGKIGGFKVSSGRVKNVMFIRTVQ